MRDTDKNITPLSPGGEKKNAEDRLRFAQAAKPRAPGCAGRNVRCAPARSCDAPAAGLAETAGDTYAPLSSGLSQDILTWYDKNARVLPWRGQRDAYRVWVSEIMLQQTRVETVIGYYARFLKALPDIASLAQASDQILHKLWEGLGYYSRVLNMKKAAGQLLRAHGGVFPRSFEQLLELPGFGRYTAGAVASICFGLPVPAVDGNVLRVLSRLTMDFSDITSAGTKRAFETLACRLLVPARAGDFNQAMMELGATVCLPGARARCAQCPVEHACIARQHGCVEELPARRDKKPRTVTQYTALVLISEKGVLIRQRGKTGLLAGLWEFPCVEGRLSKRQALLEMEKMGADARGLICLAPYKHLFTHVQWRMQGFAAVTKAFEAPGFVWADKHSLKETYALPSAFKPYVALLDTLSETVRTQIPQL